MNKKLLSERDICTKFITPALMQAGWDFNTQVRKKVTFTNGEIISNPNIEFTSKKNLSGFEF
jgi:type I restriction enzyme R subunit